VSKSVSTTFTPQLSSIIISGPVLQPNIQRLGHLLVISRRVQNTYSRCCYT